MADVVKLVEGTIFYLKFIFVQHCDYAAFIFEPFLLTDSNSNLIGSKSNKARLSQIKGSKLKLRHYPREQNI